MKRVFEQSVVFALFQGSIFYVYAIGCCLGVFLVISDVNASYHTTYDEVYR